LAFGDVYFARAMIKCLKNCKNEQNKVKIQIKLYNQIEIKQKLKSNFLLNLIKNHFIYYRIIFILNK
jgi:hypothetical protein